MRALPLVLALAVLPACSFGLTVGPDGVETPDADTPEGNGPGTPDDEEAEVDTLPSTAVDLDGKLYAIAPADMHVTEPPGLDALFGEVLTRDVLVYVESESDTSLELAVALAGTAGGQDPCEAVRHFPAGDWTENPVFEVGPGELSTRFGGHPATFRDLELSGVFDEYAFAWRDGTLSAQLDTRELAPALGDMDDLCGLVSELGGECVPCDDGEDACFALRIEDIVAELVEESFDATPDASRCPG